MERGAVLGGAVERLVLPVGFEEDGAAKIGLHPGINHGERARGLERVSAVVRGGMRVLAALTQPATALAGAGGRSFGVQRADLLPASEAGDEGEDNEQSGGESKAAVTDQLGERVADDSGNHEERVAVGMVSPSEAAPRANQRTKG